MNLYEQIKVERIECKKLKKSFEAEVLTTLQGEIQRSAATKEPTDEEVYKVVQKYLNSLDEIISCMEKQEQPVDTQQAERIVVAKYQLKQFTEGELSNLIDTLIEELEVTSKRDMGKVMRTLTTSYKGMYDGNVASKMVVTKLN